MVTVACRDFLPGFAAISNATASLPLLLSPPVIVTQSALVKAVHPQRSLVLTLTLLVVVVPLTVRPVDESVYVHGGNVPSG